ncbi:Uncharacterised protein [uncultured archaeon]|nr:Uncharacterised protein [uncultured archaeon]
MIISVTVLFKEFTVTDFSYQAPLRNVRGYTRREILDAKGISKAHTNKPRARLLTSPIRCVSRITVKIYANHGIFPTTTPFAKSTAAFSPTALPTISRLTIVAAGMVAMMPPNLGSNASASHVVPAMAAPPIKNLIKTGVYKIIP